MKLKIKTLTGKSFQMEADETTTIKSLKEEIFKSGKVTGAVRILKDKEALEDDETLEDYEIQDGDTVNIVIEPEKEIEIMIENFRDGLSSFTYKVSNTITGNELKAKLASEDEMVVPLKDFHLGICGSREYYYGLYKYKVTGKIEDESLPLHHYDINADARLKIVRNIMSREIENQKGEILKLVLSIETTVGELRQMIADMLGKPAKVFVIFIRPNIYNNKKYSKLADDEAPIGETAKFYLIENRFSKKLPDINQSDIDVQGIEAGDTVLSVKLRAQDQEDVPVHRVRVLQQPGCRTCNRYPYDDSEVIEYDKKIFIDIAKKK